MCKSGQAYTSHEGFAESCAQPDDEKIICARPDTIKSAELVTLRVTLAHEESRF